MIGKKGTKNFGIFKSENGLTCFSVFKQIKGWEDVIP